MVKQKSPSGGVADEDILNICIMKIVYCLEGLHYSGGLERIIVSKANYLVSQGIEVCIITSEDNDKPSFFKLDSRVKHYDLGINFYAHCNDSLYKQLYYNFNCKIKYKHSLLNLLNEISPDIVISTFNRELCVLTHYNGTKILEYHFSRYAFEEYHRLKSFKFYDVWRHRKFLKAISRYDRFVVLTHEDAENWKEFEHVAVIPNINSFECEESALLNQPVVMAAGRLTEQKGFDKLIEAWSIVCKKVDGWFLHIYGEGALRNELQKLIDKEGLSKRCFLDGVCNNMKEKYLGSSIFVLSSVYEGFGLVLTEAMTCGVPVVSFACPCGPRDIIADEESGFLVSQGNVEELADKLIYLIQNPEKRKEMGAKAKLGAVNFSKEKVMKMWIELFEDLCNNRK